MKAFAVPPCVVLMLSVRKKTRTEYSEQVLLFHLERMLSHRAVDPKFTVSGDERADDQASHRGDRLRIGESGEDCEQIDNNLSNPCQTQENGVYSPCDQT